MRFSNWSALDEHAAGATRGIKDTPMKGLEDFYNEFNEGGRCEELTTALPFAHGKVSAALQSLFSISPRFVFIILAPIKIT